MPPLGRLSFIRWLEDIVPPVPLPSRSFTEPLVRMGREVGRGLDWLRDQLAQDFQGYESRPWWTFASNPGEHALHVGRLWGKTLTSPPPPDELEELKRRARKRDQEAVLALAAHFADTYGIPRSLFFAILRAESNYQHWDENGRVLRNKTSGATGIGQLTPATAKDMGVDPYDVVGNLEGAARRLRQLLDMFDGDVEKAVAGYNAGPYAVKTLVETYGSNWKAYLPDETKRYLPTVLGAAAGEAAAQAAQAGQQAGLYDIEAQIEDLKKLGFSEAEARALLRRSWLTQNLGVSTDPMRMLQAGLGWLANLSEARRQALAASAQAQADATKLYTSLLSRAAPGGRIPGMEPGGTIEWFSRLAGLPPMQQPQTRTVDLGPLFETAAALRPEADPYFAALAAAASRLGTDVQGLWEQALKEMETYMGDNTVPPEARQALEDWRRQVLEGAQSPMDVFARIGLAF